MDFSPSSILITQIRFFFPGKDNWTVDYVGIYILLHDIDWQAYVKILCNKKRTEQTEWWTNWAWGIYKKTPLLSGTDKVIRYILTTSGIAPLQVLHLYIHYGLKQF